MSNKKKIVFVLNTLAGGGIARVVTTFANHIAEQGLYEAYLVVLHKKQRLYALHPDVKVIENEAKRVSGGKVLYIFKSVVFIRKAIQLIGTCSVIANGEWLNSFVYLSLFGLGRRVYFADHSNPERKGQSPFPRIDRWVYPRVGGVLVLSEAAKSKIEEQYGQRRVLLLDNPVAFPLSMDVPRKSVILCMGRLSAEKGQDLLLKAFSHTVTDWKLWFLGDGPFRKELEQLTAQLGLKDRVEFLGQQQNTARYLNQAGIYVMPSHTENFPMALIEAMGIGLPCIATNCMPWRGASDFINDGHNGLKVPVNDDTALAAAITKLIADEDLRCQLGKNALEIRHQFNMDITLKQLIEYVI